MRKRIALLLNHKPGIEVCDYLINIETVEIVAIFITGEDLEYSSIINSILGHRGIPVFEGKEIWSPATINNLLKPLNIDFLISVYWPWLLKDSALSLFKDSINFHPALLPKNRGWFPHVYNIKDNTQAGVTLHRIVSEADAGDIWASKAVPILPTDIASDLYDRLQVEIVSLFKEVWPKIVQGEVEAVQQDHSEATYNSKKAISVFDEINLDSVVNVREFINLLRSRTFNQKGFAFYYSEGKKISISVSLKEISQD